MAKHKSPSELNSRVIRINVGTYLLLIELSRKLDISMAEAVDLAITDRAKREQVTVTPRTQIPMPLIEAYQAIPATVYRSISKTAIATNGSKAAAFRIKSKGVRRE